MDLRLSERCPIFEPSNAPELFEVLRTVKIGWHTILSPRPEFLATAIPIAYSVYGDYIEQSYKSGALRSNPAVGPKDCDGCVAGDLAKFLALPTIILVENGTNDGDFVKEVARTLRRGMMPSLEGIDASVEFYNAGGIDNLRTELTRISRRHSTYRREGLPPRFIVMVDSDAKSPGRIGGSAEKARKLAEQAGFSVHVLEKRSIENYVPDGTLTDHFAARTDRLKAVGVILGMHATARDHFPMKDGIASVSKLPQEQATLYDGLDDKIEGLSEFMLQLMRKPRGVFAKKDLEARDHSADLNKLLSKIEENI